MEVTEGHMIHSACTVHTGLLGSLGMTEFLRYQCSGRDGHWRPQDDKKERVSAASPYIIPL